ncbi:lysophospholipid acyltransferase family protein [bacterium]|nr:lysophospholipid acyltransferase family protein [bacterium]
MLIESKVRVRRLPPKKRLIKLIGRITFWCMTKTAGLLRPWSVRLIGQTLGSAFYQLSSRYRNVALKNLRSVYADNKSEEEIQVIAKEVFKHFSQAAVEFFYLISLSRDRIDSMIDLQDGEHISSVLSEGKGCIILTAHYGNWELLARKLVILGYKVNVIARDSDDPGMTGITERIREDGGYRVFDRDQPIIGAFRALKNNEILGILPDQNDSSGIFVDFFGRPSKTATGTAVLSLKSGAPIVPVFARRVNGGKYQAKVYPRIEYMPTGDHERDVCNLTELVNAAIEHEIRSNPSQWLWLHDRWKLSPSVSAASTMPGKESPNAR